MGVFVQPFPGPGLRRQLSSTGDFPVWRKDGKEILYVDPKPDRISAIPVSELSGDVRFGPPAVLFAVPPTMNWVVGRNPMAVTHDGSRIMIPLALPQPEDSNVIHIRSGWFETH